MCDKRKRLPIVGKKQGFKAPWRCAACGITDFAPTRLCEPRKQ